MRWYDAAPPRADLQHVLACTWTAVPHGRHTLVPDACSDLLWLGPRDGSDLGAVWLCGPEVRAWSFEQPPGTVGVGVRFRPGLAAATLHLDVSSIRDRRVRWADLRGPAAERALCEQARGGRFEDAVAEVAIDLDRDVASFADAVLDALTARPRIAQADLAGQLGLTPRQLHRRSTATFGYGTSVLARILRFHRFVALHDAHPDQPVSVLAAEAGYADQAHHARDCRAITGRTVRAFLTEWFPTFPDVSDPFKTPTPLRATLAG